MEHNLNLVNLHEVVGIFLGGRHRPICKAEGKHCQDHQGSLHGSLPLIRRVSLWDGRRRSGCTVGQLSTKIFSVAASAAAWKTPTEHLDAPPAAVPLPPDIHPVESISALTTCSRISQP
jgi:hypothetical protein